MTLVGLDRAYLRTTQHSIEHSDAVTAVSRYLALYTHAEMGVKRPIAVVPNAVDSGRFRPNGSSELRLRYAHPEEKLLTHVSNFRAVKRVEDVIRTFAGVAEEVGARLLMIGDGPERPKAFELAAKLGVSGRVAFLGSFPRVEHLLSVSDLFLLPSSEESFGLAALEAMAPLRANHATVSGLADLVAGRGQNGRRMSLHSYVLAARLEEVLVAASARLSQMSSGRYEFVHSDAMGPHGRRGGLGIEVRDEYTGAVRATTTLSGGETFYASLALALGLADVVSAEAGGRVLDTIFIDEGFGTLDPEALDEVMGVLDELRSGGRVVGLVSHVDELRARIPGRLHVIRGENGSRLQMESVALPA